MFISTHTWKAQTPQGFLGMTRIECFPDYRLLQRQAAFHVFFKIRILTELCVVDEDLPNAQCKNPQSATLKTRAKLTPTEKQHTTTVTIISATIDIAICVKRQTKESEKEAEKKKLTPSE